LFKNYKILTDRRNRFAFRFIFFIRMCEFSDEKKLIYICDNRLRVKVTMTTNLEIIKAVKSRLNEELGDDLNKVILFGSRINQKANEFSDFDVLIILNTPVHWKTKNLIRDICFYISLEHDVLIDSKIIYASDLETKFWGKHPLFTDAIKNGIHV
jgi:predicted nucleotidyltransferase